MTSDIFWPDGHQQEHGASTQRLLHLFRHHHRARFSLMSPASMPLTARGMAAFCPSQYVPVARLQQVLPIRWYALSTGHHSRVFITSGCRAHAAVTGRRALSPKRTFVAVSASAARAVRR
ncbi:hypothetical protein KCP74_25270 [Salmonella enterica subsp. enterica]|nr:hypothetical protein KCP74_25270 [Salmonella enterica subsp. enterica]